MAGIAARGSFAFLGFVKVHGGLRHGRLRRMSCRIHQARRNGLQSGAKAAVQRAYVIGAFKRGFQAGLLGGGGTGFTVSGSLVRVMQETAFTVARQT